VGESSCNWMFFSSLGQLVVEFLRYNEVDLGGG
jgi:hypothetical protein